MYPGIHVCPRLGRNGASVWQFFRGGDLCAQRLVRPGVHSGCGNPGVPPRVTAWLLLPSGRPRTPADLRERTHARDVLELLPSWRQTFRVQVFPPECLTPEALGTEVELTFLNCGPGSPWGLGEPRGGEKTLQ